MNNIIIEDYCSLDDLSKINQIEIDINHNNNNIELKNQINDLLEKIIDKRNKMINDVNNNYINNLVKRFKLKNKEELFELIPPFEKITLPTIKLNKKCEQAIHKLIKLFEMLI